MPSIPVQEKKWQAQDDAHTLAAAKEIESDKKRHNAAKKEAVNMAKEHEKRTKAMKQVAGKQTPKTSKPTKKK